MNRKTAQLASTLLAAVALTAACSGDSNDSEGGTSGTGGGGGTTSNPGGAGKAGAGKAGSSAAGTSNNGGSNNGGSNNGGSNNGGTGGFNPDDYMCDPVPEQGSTCAEDAQPCLNGMEVCLCQMGEWSCDDFGQGEGAGGPTIGEIECPATQPMTGSACGDVIGFCPYGGQNMGCGCFNGMWTCTTP